MLFLLEDRFFDESSKRIDRNPPVSLRDVLQRRVIGRISKQSIHLRFGSRYVILAWQAYCYVSCVKCAALKGWLKAMCKWSEKYRSLLAFVFCASWKIIVSWRWFCLTCHCFFNQLMRSLIYTGSNALSLLSPGNAFINLHQDHSSVPSSSSLGLTDRQTNLRGRNTSSCLSTYRQAHRQIQRQMHVEGQRHTDKKPYRQEAIDK